MYRQNTFKKEEKEMGNTNHSTVYKRYERTCNITSAKFTSMLYHPIDPHVISDTIRKRCEGIYWNASLMNSFAPFPASDKKSKRKLRLLNLQFLFEPA